MLEQHPKKHKIIIIITEYEIFKGCHYLFTNGTRYQSSKINTLLKCVLTGWLRPFYLVIYWRERIGMLCSNCLSSLDITCNIKVIYACWTWVIIVKNYCKFCTKQSPLKLTILTVYSSVFFFPVIVWRNLKRPLS